MCIYIWSLSKKWASLNKIEAVLFEIQGHHACMLVGVAKLVHEGCMQLSAKLHVYISLECVDVESSDFVCKGIWSI